MTKKEYRDKKEEQRKIWMEKVFAHGMCETREEEYKLRNEAMVKFNKEYPPYEEHTL